ncbi:hypothetical protein D5086_029521 [Populus alba]|uniref:Uncharacterized protein n=1 Tax=Populus alba TaxID=43335 RepID=A0ACC4AUM8_POPAL
MGSSQTSIPPKINCFLTVLFLFLSTSSAQNVLRRGSSLSVEDDSDILISPDKTFSCGFYGLGQNAYWFSIWFTNSKDRTVVWMANRDRPANGRGSRVSLRRDGAMVLTDVDGSIIWETNTTSTDVGRAELLDTGCKPMFNSTLSQSQQVKFVLLPHVDYWGFDLNYSESTTFNSCMKLCLGDYRCKAFSYRLDGKALCYTKGVLFNGYQSPSFPGNIYLRLPDSVETSQLGILNGTDLICQSAESETTIGSPSMYNFNTKRTRWVYFYSFASAIGLVEILFVVSGWWFLFGKRGSPNLAEDGYNLIVKGIPLSNWVIEGREEDDESDLTRFVRVVKRKIQCGETSWIEEVVDPRLNGQFNRSQATTIVELGMSCVEEDRNKRPTMDSAVQALLECLDES